MPQWKRGCAVGSGISCEVWCRFCSESVAEIALGVIATLVALWQVYIAKQQGAAHLLS
jgi:hypothetical protein